MNGIVRVIYNNGTRTGEIPVTASGAIDMSGGIESLATLVLFTDRRVEDRNSHRGWWADSFSKSINYKLGSELWTLSGQKATTLTINKARKIVKSAFNFMIEDGLVEKFDVVVERLSLESIAIHSTFYRPKKDPIKMLWEANLNAL